MTNVQATIRRVNAQVPNSVTPETRISLHPADWIELTEEIERLDKKCAALAFLQYGSPAKLDTLDIYEEHDGLRAISPAKVLKIVEENERLKDALKRVRRVAAEGTTHLGLVAELGILVDRSLNPGNGPLPPDYRYGHEPKLPPTHHVFEFIGHSPQSGNEMHQCTVCAHRILETPARHK